MTGGTITSGTGKGININSSNSIVTITGGTIEGATYGVYNYASSDDYSPALTITGGTITGGTYGVYNNGDTATLQIGDSKAALSTTSPVISGGTYGVYSSSSSSEVSFYGGVIKGTKATPYSVAGTLTLRDGYSIVVEDKTATDGLYWAYLETQLVIDSGPSDITVTENNSTNLETTASGGSGTLSYQWYYNDTDSNIGGTPISGANSSTYKFTAELDDAGYYYCVVTDAKGQTVTTDTAQVTVLDANYSITNSGIKTYYNTLALAIADAEDSGDTIVTEKDVEDSSIATVTKDVTLDNNSKTITKTTASITVNEGKTFEITGEGTITTSDLTNLLEISGDLIKTGSGTIYGETNAINLSKNGNITIQSGIVKGEAIGMLISSSHTGTVTIDGGEIIGVTSNTIWNGGNGTIIVNDGKLTRENGTASALGSGADGIIEINGGEITATSLDGLSIYKGTNVTVTNGTIVGNRGIVCQSTYTGKVITEGGTITADSAAVESLGSGAVIVNAGTLVGGEHGIFCGANHSGTVTVEGGAITTTGAHAVANCGSGTVTVNGGDLINEDGVTTSVLYGQGTSKIEVHGGNLTSTNDLGVVVSVWEDVDVTIAGGTFTGKHRTCLPKHAYGNSNY